MEFRDERERFEHGTLPRQRERTTDLASVAFYMLESEITSDPESEDGEARE